MAITVAAYHAATMSPSALPSRLHLAFQGLRLRLRGSDLWFIALALLVGLIAGYLTLLQSGIARWLQGTLYGLDEGMRLSSLPSLTWTALAGAFVADQAGIEAYLLPAASTIDVRAGSKPAPVSLHTGKRPEGAVSLQR
ncbi:hypothetical protein ACOZB2_32930 [Pantoea endophytica]